MKIHLVTFYTKEYTSRAHRLRDSALKNGVKVSSVLLYNEQSPCVQAFFKNSPDLLKHKRGYGCMAWKPVVILDALERIPSDDVLLYCDADLTITESLEPLLNYFQGTENDNSRVKTILKNTGQNETRSMVLVQINQNFTTNIK